MKRDGPGTGSIGTGQRPRVCADQPQEQSIRGLGTSDLSMGSVSILKHWSSQTDSSGMWKQAEHSWTPDEQVHFLSLSLSFFFFFLIWPMPTLCGSSRAQGLNWHHGTYLSHSSDNTRSLTRWATRELQQVHFFEESLGPWQVLERILGFLWKSLWLDSWSRREAISHSVAHR